MLNKLKTLLNHERYQVVTALVCVGLILYGIGCESQVPSLLNPAEKVCRSELQAEVELYLAKAETKFKALDQQDQLKALLFEKAALFSQTGTFNPIGILPTVFAIFGIGAITDNARRRRDERNAAKNNTTDNS